MATNIVISVLREPPHFDAAPAPARKMIGSGSSSGTLVISDRCCSWADRVKLTDVVYGTSFAAQICEFGSWSHIYILYKNIHPKIYTKYPYLAGSSLSLSIDGRCERWLLKKVIQLIILLYKLPVFYSIFIRTLMLCAFVRLLELTNKWFESGKSLFEHSFPSWKIFAKFFKN
jgi:hypothetical protein